MVAQLAPQLMPHAATQVHIGNGEQVKRNNDELQGNRHTSEEVHAARRWAGMNATSEIQ